MSFSNCNKCQLPKAKAPFRQCYDCNQKYKESFKIDDYDKCIICSRLTKKPFKKCYTCKDVKPPEKVENGG
jgi:hypothetical protein